MYGSVHFEGNQLYSVSKPYPIDMKYIEYMYVKSYDMKAKIKRALVISTAVSALPFMIHPLISIIVFSATFIPLYLKTSRYELRVLANNSSGYGAKEMCLHRSDYRDEYDLVIEKMKALKQAEVV